MSRNVKRASCRVVLAAVALLAGASSARAIASSPAVAQVGSMVYDGSLKTQLARLRSTMGEE